MESITGFLNTYIPPTIVYKKKEYQFQLFINHPHYDIRVGYINNDAQPSFIGLFENISNDADLLETLKELHILLKRKRLLTDDYKTKEGYTFEKYQNWINSL